MRVAVASWTARHVGGIEAYAGAITRALSHAGVDVSFFHEVDAPAERSPIDVGASVPKFNVAASGVDRAIADLSKWNPDIIYVQGLHDPHTADRLLELAPSVTFVHTYTGTCISGTKTHLSPEPAACSRRFGPPCLALYFPRRCGGSNPATMVRLYRTQSKRQEALKRQAAVITHSDHMKRELEQHGVNPKVLPYPICTPDVVGTSSPPQSGDILFAGRMEAVKGGMLLLDALPQIRRALNQPVHVRFVGDGPARDRWEARARQITAGDPQVGITFTGWLDEARLGAQMMISRLLVVPSLWPEPFGSVGVSAARFGVPAAAFDVGGIPQWLHDGVSGHLAPSSPPTASGFADAVVKCLRDPAHYVDLSNGARTIARRFTMERHLPDLLAMFKGLVDVRR